MSSRRENNYVGLEEAIESIMCDEENNSEYDILLLPPNPAVVSDEEEGNEDDLTLSTFPRDVPCTIEVVARRHTDDNNLNDSDEEDHRSRPSKKARLQENEPIWRKTKPYYKTTYGCADTVQSNKVKLVQLLKDHNPLMLFESIFDSEVLNLIKDNSQLYAQQNNRHNFTVEHEDIKKFLGILILTGYHKLPKERAYWSLDEDIGIPLVAKCMSRNRFYEIKRNIHFADNSLAEGTDDKMFKMRPLCDLIQTKSCQWGVFHENLSVDESMIKYFGHHPAKQFIMGKPVRFGFRNWAVTSSDGYCYNFDIYCGRSLQTSTEPLGTRVVKSLLTKIPTVPNEHVVYFDNFFTNYQLLHDLRLLGYRATGTMRENRTKKCPLTSVKDMKKQLRADFDYRFDTKNEILIVRWMDNNVVTIGTNFDDLEPMGKVKRWCSSQKQKIDVNMPNLLVNYNKGMGGVDQMDQSISLYRVAIRGKKWWWVIFTYIVDLAISNAWRLHVLLCKEKEIAHMDQFSFRRSIARAYLQPTKTISRPPSSNISTLDRKNFGHNPERIEKQLHCVVCHSRVRWRCEICKKTLCVERPCFGKYHT